MVALVLNKSSRVIPGLGYNTSSFIIILYNYNEINVVL